MEKLIQKQEKLQQALLTLNEALEVLAQQKKNSSLYRICRDSVIQRFEYTFDSTWKFLKLYLEKIHGITAPSPRTVIREAFTAGIIPAKKAEILLDAVSARNTTSHVYQENIAEEIVKHVPLFFAEMDFVAKLETK